MPIYMLNRYQVEAASKLIGGMDYTFALRGDGETPTQIVPAAEQRRALAAVLATLKPEKLALPEPLLKSIPPRPPMYERDREDFKIHTSPAFDALSPAESLSQHTLQFLFNPQRAARLVEFHARNPQDPGFAEILDAVVNSTWKALHKTGYDGEIANTVDNVALYYLMNLSADEHASEQVRAIAALQLHELKTYLDAQQASHSKSLDRAHIFFALRQIDLFEKDPKRIDVTAPVEAPDGPPIGGSGSLDCDWN